MSTVIQDRNQEVQDRFLSLFKNSQTDGLLAGFREKAAARFEEVPFPGRRDEDWKYTSVNRIIQNSYTLGQKSSLDAGVVAKYSVPGLNACQLVFVNGIYHPELSKVEGLPEHVTISSLAEAAEMNDPLLPPFQEWLLKGANAFYALNGAMALDGIFVHVPANAIVKTPIHFLHLATHTEQATISSPQRLISVENNAEVSFIESYHSVDGNETSSFTNAATRIWVGKNAKVDHYRIQLENAQSFQVNQTEVSQQRDSTYSSYAVDLGGRIVRNNLASILKDSNTMTNLYGVYLGTGEQHIDNQTFMDHAFPHCNSNEMYKGILKDKSRGVFNGKVIVRPDAQKTNAFQQSSSLVLSDKAVMDSKPQLEIFADDVKCSHGATIGQLDESSIFYLRSRGLTADQSRSLLQLAFIGEVLENFPSDEVREWVEGYVQEKF